MHLFPERDRRDRSFFLTALAISLVVHLVVGAVWAVFGHRLVPHPVPAEIVALSDAIRIEKRAVPRASHRTPRAVPAPPRLAARLPAYPLSLPSPTLPSAAPTRVRRHVAAVAVPREPAERAPASHVPPAAAAASSAFSAREVAALDAQFRRTIDAAQRSLSEVPPPRQPPAAPQRYDRVMAGTPEQFLSAQGECEPAQPALRHGAQVDRYLRCVIHYSDGYFEEVTFPWLFHFTRQNDPFAYQDGGSHPFPMQPPPERFALPHPFALSRAICSFYRPDCKAVIDAERANGDTAPR